MRRASRRDFGSFSDLTGGRRVGSWTGAGRRSSLILAAPWRSRPRSPGLRRALLLVVAMVVLAGLVQLASAAAEIAAESRFLKVKRVTVRGNAYVTDEVIVKTLGELEGRSLLDVHTGKLETRLLAHPRLCAAKVRRSLDRGLMVEVTERRPIALLEAQVLVELDAEGRVLPPVARGALPDLPILVGLGIRPPSPGTRLQSPALRAALGLIDDLGRSDPDLLAAVSQIDLSQNPIFRLSLAERPVVLVVHRSSLSPAKLAGVRSVLDDLERRGRRSVEVDLRFEGQLVVRELTERRPPRAPGR